MAYSKTYLRCAPHVSFSCKLIVFFFSSEDYFRFFVYFQWIFIYILLHFLVKFGYWSHMFEGFKYDFFAHFYKYRFYGFKKHTKLKFPFRWISLYQQFVFLFFGLCFFRFVESKFSCFTSQSCLQFKFRQRIVYQNWVNQTKPNDFEYGMRCKWHV